MPQPLLFADTNWPKDFFGFTLNPCTEQLEFWRFDYTGSLGVPMNDWKPYLDGSLKEPRWGIFIEPHKYK